MERAVAPARAALSSAGTAGCHRAAVGNSRYRARPVSERLRARHRRYAGRRTDARRGRRSRGAPAAGGRSAARAGDGALSGQAALRAGVSRAHAEQRGAIRDWAKRRRPRPSISASSPRSMLRTGETEIRRRPTMNRPVRPSRIDAGPSGPPPGKPARKSAARAWTIFLVAGRDRGRSLLVEVEPRVAGVGVRPEDSGNRLVGKAAGPGSRRSDGEVAGASRGTDVSGGGAEGESARHHRARYCGRPRR